MTQDVNSNSQGPNDMSGGDMGNMNMGGSNPSGQDMGPSTENENISLERDLFADLSPAQLNIKKTELLQNYANLYDTITSTFENVNKLNKTNNNLKVIEFITDKLTSLKEYVNQIITTSYSTKTYIENLENFKQCLLMMSQIDTMLKGLIQTRDDEKDKESKSKKQNSLEDNGKDEKDSEV